MRRQTLAAATLALLLTPAAASAATDVQIRTDAVLQVRNTEAITPAQHLRISTADGLITVRDELGGRVDPGIGCRRVGAATDRVVCTEAAVDSLFVDSGLGNDRVTNLTPLRALVNGSSGDDVLVGGSAVDTLKGGGNRDTLRGGGGSDRLEGENGDDELEGGPGDDVALGGEGDDRLFGLAPGSGAAAADGDDRLDGGDGNDIVDGDAGDDVLVGGRGRDSLDGAAGTDTADYSGHPAGGVTATLDGLSNDGGIVDQVSGVGERIGTTVENIVGSVGNDLLVGDDRANLLNGRGGDDLLQAAGGSDTLLGSTGADTLSGGDGFDTASYRDHADDVSVKLDDRANDGNELDRVGDDVRGDVEAVHGTDESDTLIGSVGPDRLVGFGGLDFIVGLAGRDVIDGGDGDDRIDAQDGEPDVVSCGRGDRDGAGLDLVDTAPPALGSPLPGASEITVPRDCEFLGTVPFGERPTLRLVQRRLMLVRGGRAARVRIACLPAAIATCRGRLLLETPAGGRLGARTFSLRPARVRAVTVRLRPARRAASSRLPRVGRRVRVVALSVGPSGRPHAAVRLLAR
jgi:Ca2+-binding RTX toxin-like protein